MNGEQNESFLEVFKDAKELKITASQRSQPVHRATPANKEVDYFDEIFNDEPVKREAPAEQQNNSGVGDNTNFDLADLLKDNVVQQCPICCKNNKFEQPSSFVAHLKSCANKNKITTEQMMKAIVLQQKQLTERVALGLPAVTVKEKAKRNYTKKTTVDSNLELGMALSNSLRESEILSKIEERESLIIAGIEPEVLSQCKSLQDFGFTAPNRAAESNHVRGSNRSKINRNTVLFSRTQEERERIITEKVAILLVDCDVQNATSFEIADSSECTINSKMLNRIIDKNISLWKKSYQLDEDSEACYYVKNLSGFIIPCKPDIKAKLRHLSQIPCRPRSPETPVVFPNPMESLPKFPSPQKLLLQKFEKSVGKDFESKAPSFTPSKLSQDWRYMLNKNLLSDITIYAKNETPIYAHKLVFYARCRSILSDTITETTNNVSKDMLMWMEYSYEVIVTFLEYIYTDMFPSLTSLASGQREELKELLNRYGFKELAHKYDDVAEIKLFPGKENDTPERFETRTPSLVTKTEFQYEENIDTPEEMEIHTPSPVTKSESERNLELLELALQTQNLLAQSPVLFEETESLSDDDSVKSTESTELNFNNSISETSKGIIDEVLSTLCSPVRARTSHEDMDVQDRISSPEIICIDDEVLTQMPNDAGQISFAEKRRSLSPLQKSQLKKSKLQGLSDEDTPKKQVLNEVFSVSDTSQSSNVDEVDGGMEFQNHIEKSEKLNGEAPEDHIAGNTSYKSDNEVPYISPIWDGFDDVINMENYDVPDSPHERKSPLVSPGFRKSVKKTSSPVKSSTPQNGKKHSVLGESLFGSFSIDEDILDKLESKYGEKERRKTATPNSVRKFQRRSMSDNVITPKNTCRVNDVTPMADYSNMKNSEIKKELDKYGLKPGLSKNKAKMMLRYIYDQLHPFEDEINHNETNHATRPDVRTKSSKTDSDESSSTETSGVSVLEETFMEESSDTQEIVDKSKRKVDLNTGFKNLLNENKQLHQSILLYEPVWLESLKHTLKGNGVKCSLNELMNFLDEKCITFRTAQQRGQSRRKKKAETQKQPKRKLINDHSLSQP